MLHIAILLAIVGAVFGPSLWARWVLASHGDDRPDFPGTGGELARHLLDEAGLGHVAVETTTKGDHYDPAAKALRLAQAHHDGRTLTAVVVATHEFGHALQDRDAYPPLRNRTRLVLATAVTQRIASAIVWASLLAGLVTRAPFVTLAGVGAAILTLSISVIIHLVTLPVEFDASFERALPVLDRGGYLPKRDLPAARRILTACALTYVAASLAALLNLWRWLRYIR